MPAVWANGRVIEEFGVEFDIVKMLEADMRGLDVYAPPKGNLLVALDGARPAGIVGLKQSAPGIAEMKRMYVRPAARGQGTARTLVGALLTEARGLGYGRIRLDSAGFMTEAHALYRSFGFEDIHSYPESEITAGFRPHWVFMEKRLEP